MKQIRVGRRVYSNGGYIDPVFPGFKPIIVMTASTAYGELSPYSLTNKKGQIIENVWQYSKIYETIPDVKIPYSKYDSKIIWEHPKETHLNNGKITKTYWKWREKGMNNPYAVRYPVGYNHRHKCLYSLKDIGDDFYLELDYIEARKEIYVPLYLDSVVHEQKFQKLKKMLENENLLIIEVDGPHSESMPYYKEKYGVEDDFIVGNTILATKENFDILLKDPKHPFGHGYCLAMALLDLFL